MFLKRNPTETFFCKIFLKLSKKRIFRICPEKCIKQFVLEARSFWIITLWLRQKDFTSDFFLTNLQIFQGFSSEFFSRSLFQYLLKSESLVCRPAKLIEKEEFYKGFWEFLKFYYNILSFLDTYQYRQSRF